ncbi:MAG TPA: type II toxin-antitoxin system prevent-host-death family antitoxin [Bacteroides clarus]|uniref:type II toxin-antitoxin system Phd/YefM family antitoxin n=1 Tax=Bacteroides clarus TaxID=626929 RepID=UPI001DA93E87|nr:type II toxin-antitoxin system prevent-host-death family antitoxin [Bacteroides clarus]HJG00249.1 type II toxin-antitoxin system prevent-host-death family antitoxin [Bacteroides clarus]
MRTANYSELRNNLKHYLDGVINDSEPLLVHRSGSESVVVISLDEYNSIKETEYIMKSPATMEAIRKGEEDIKNGNCVSQHEGESMSDFLNRVVCTK